MFDEDHPPSRKKAKAVSPGKPAAGQCLCGKVVFEIDVQDFARDIGHAVFCRLWSCPFWVVWTAAAETSIRRRDSLDPQGRRWPGKWRFAAAGPGPRHHNRAPALGSQYSGGPSNPAE